MSRGSRLHSLCILVLLSGCCTVSSQDALVSSSTTSEEYVLRDNDDGGMFDSGEKLPCSHLAGYAYHNESQMCYLLGSKGPCPDLMKFYSDPEREGFGDCDCLAMRNCIGRPRTYWPATDKCYFLYSKGPCKPGQWLVFNKDRKPECQDNPCGRKEKNQPLEFWFHHEGTCYRTGTQAFCEKSETVYLSSSDLQPRCYSSRPNCRFLVFSAQSLSCRPGSKLDVTGQCDHMRDVEK